MSKPKDLSELSVIELSKRETAAAKKRFLIKEEFARRERVRKYGTENPVLRRYSVTVEHYELLTVSAASAEDAIAIVEEHGSDFASGQVYVEDTGREISDAELVVEADEPTQEEHDSMLPASSPPNESQPIAELCVTGGNLH